MMRAIALTIDRGMIDAGDRSRPLCEIELELKRGKVADLFDVAGELTRALPGARLAVKSKSQRGYELLDDEQDGRSRLRRSTCRPAHARATLSRSLALPALSRSLAMSRPFSPRTPRAFTRCVWALRRLRAAMSLFSDLLRDPQTAAIKTELKWLASELGPAREFEVLVNRVIAPIKKNKRRGIACRRSPERLQRSGKLPLREQSMQCSRRAFVRSRSRSPLG